MDVMVLATLGIKISPLGLGKLLGAELVAPAQVQPAELRKGRAEAHEFLELQWWIDDQGHLTCQAGGADKTSWCLPSLPFCCPRRLDNNAKLQNHQKRIDNQIISRKA